MKAVQITVTKEQYEWIQEQPRVFNLSEKVRNLLEDLIKNKKEEEKN